LAIILVWLARKIAELNKAGEDEGFMQNGVSLKNDGLYAACGGIPNGKFDHVYAVGITNLGKLSNCEGWGRC